VLSRMWVSANAVGVVVPWASMTMPPVAFAYLPVPLSPVVAVAEGMMPRTSWMFRRWRVMPLTVPASAA
jgi:hypothetical protein